MIGPLWRKELREHGGLLLGLLVIEALGFAGLAINALEGEGAIEALRRFVLAFGPLTAMFLCNRLVVREYSASTQLFLEILPVTRARILVSKFSFGALVLLLLMGLATAASVKLAAGRDFVSWQRAGWLLLRCGLYLLFLYSLAFFAALLGRLRIYVWGAFVLLLYAAQKLTQAGLKGIPFVSIVGDHFTRGAPAANDALLTLGFLAAFWIASAALALGKEGLVAAFLAQRMTARGKVVAAGVALVALMAVFVLDERKPRPPFALNAAGRATEKAVEVAVGTSSEEGADAARTLARRLAQSLDAMREALELREVPPIFVLPAADVDPGVFQRVELTRRDGVVVSAGPTDLALPDQLERQLRRDLLAWSTRHALPEEYEWLADGFAEAFGEDPVRDRALKVAWAFQRTTLPLDGSVLRQWRRTRETLGSCLANAVAAAAAQAVAAQVGPDVWSALVRDALGRRPPEDVRALTTWPRLDVLLARHHAPNPDQLVPTLRKDVSALRTALAAIPVRAARFESRLASARSRQREIHWVLSGPPTSLRLLYRVIAPWTEELSRETLRRIDITDGSSGILPLTLPKGEGLFVTAELDEPALGCAVRVGTFRGNVE